ncbi:hypothetical protein METUNv1_01487 [Methyloversatilis universalis FAM5]|uniref:Lysozyme inhibitor LprI N-terminal domain-containing protein n=1 Tax=Methyloversatilis universalis (strain ATCC BAA-1314 / DSM 25237 / JCM 13912 / CCUG 52030 / FAM5) TaxID=1000565 RepID=F5RB48_METUF|nr:hypothetical protein [Methyloversatilis universalis]EGK72184.1 hypothetical protein METUNv1_01487 [Methyloversatilis universalis FAM5]
MKPDWLRTLPVACMTALGLALLAGTPPARADGAAEFSAWSSAARTRCDADARDGGRLDEVRFHRCMVDAHERSGWVPQDRIERCREKSGAFWGNRPGESDESLWNCLQREARKQADSGMAPAVAARSQHGSIERAAARRPACEAWARDNIEEGGPVLSYVSRCMYGTASPAAIGAEMRLGRPGADEGSALSQIMPADNPARAGNRAWCADQNAGRGDSGHLRFDCACVDDLTVREQRLRRIDDGRIAQRRFDLKPCLDRAATADIVVKDMGGRGLDSLLDRDSVIRTRDACYRRAVERDLDIAVVADRSRLRKELEKRCK